MANVRMTSIALTSVVVAVTACSDQVSTVNAPAFARPPRLSTAGICSSAPAGLVGWWPGDGNANDVVGGNNGTLQSAATFAAGEVGQAFSLDGAGAYIAIPDSPTLTPPSNSITLDAWIMPNAVSGPRAIVTKYSVNLDVSWVLMILDGRIRFGVYQAGSADIGRVFDTVDPVVTAGAWIHVAGTFDVATQAGRIFIDGLEVAAIPYSGQTQGTVTSIRDSNSPVRIGALQGGTGTVTYFWDGLIDEVDLFDRALAPSEIQAIAAAGSAGKCGTVAPYAFAGFLDPVQNPPSSNVVKAGSAVPVKFSLGGDFGLEVIAAGYPAVQSISCDSNAPTNDIEQTIAAGGSSLSYDPQTSIYTYVWKTDRSWASTCRRLTVKLADESVHTANFYFK
jgi:hypothetical protein